MKKRLVSFVLMLLLVLTPLTSFAQSERTLENVADSPKALSFKTTTLDGKPYSSDAIKNYDLVVLNVWAEWCGPCVWELPFLQKIYENYKNVLVLGLWWGDSVEEALETANEAGVKYPLIHSTDALDKYLRASKYIPHTIFFDRNGKEVGKMVVGSMDYNSWKQTIDERLAMLSADDPTIIGQPKNANVKSGSKAKFTVKVKEKGVTYQWFRKAPGAPDWTELPGETKATLTVVATKANSGTQYFCRVRTAEGGEANTIAATLTVKIQSPAIKTQPKNLAAKSGKKVKFSVKASGPKLTYTWYSRAKGETEWNPVPGGNKNSVSIVASKANDGTQYYCKVQNLDGSVDSAVVTLTVTPEVPTIKTQPKDAKVKIGGKAKFKVKATGKNLTYQWYYRTSETGEWILMKGETSANLTVVATADKIGWQFRCLAKNTDGQAYSKPATLRQK